MAEALPHEDQPMNLSLSHEPKASPGHLQSAPFQSNGDREHEALERQFLDGLAVTMSTAVSALRQVVLRLVSMGATRTHLIAIAAERGYKKAYVRTLLSEILIRNGGRQRKPGAGPKTSPLAKVMLAIARALAGRLAEKLLRAAAHAARKEDEAELARQQALRRGISTPAPIILNKIRPEPSPNEPELN